MSPSQPVTTLSSLPAPPRPGPAQPLPLTFRSELWGVLQPSVASPPGTPARGSGAEVVLALPDGVPGPHTLKRHTPRMRLSICRCAPWKKELQGGAGESLGPSLNPSQVAAKQGLPPAGLLGKG